MSRVRARKRRSQQGGYTLIEVMMAVAVMTVGAVGLMSLQQATTRGNVYAREMSIATQATQTWIERARRDALLWNQQGAAGVASTNYLSEVPASGAEPGEWFTPTGVETESAAFDFLGNDTAVSGAVPRYCTDVRLRWIIDQQAIRVDVRTWWHRKGSSDEEVTSTGLYANCNDGETEAITAELDRTSPRLHAVYGTTLVRWTPLNAP